MIDYIEFIRTNGIPFIQDETSTVPLGDDPGLLLSVEANSGSTGRL